MKFPEITLDYMRFSPLSSPATELEPYMHYQLTILAADIENLCPTTQVLLCNIIDRTAQIYEFMEYDIGLEAYIMAIKLLSSATSPEDFAVIEPILVAAFAEKLVSHTPSSASLEFVPVDN